MSLLRLLLDFLFPAYLYLRFVLEIDLFPNFSKKYDVIPAPYLPKKPFEWFNFIITGAALYGLTYDLGLLLKILLNKQSFKVEDAGWQALYLFLGSLFCYAVIRPINNVDDDKDEEDSSIWEIYKRPILMSIFGALFYYLRNYIINANSMP